MKMIILRGRFLFFVFLIGYVCLLQKFECLISRDYLNQLFNNGGSGEQCRERPIEENFLHADIIITGTVKSLERNASRSQKHMTTYSAQIQIHRIIKGYDLVFKLLNINVEQLTAVEQANKRNKLFAKRTSKLSMNGNLVTVRNFGAKSICESNIKPYDVRIFPLRVDVKNNNQLYLSSSLIKVKSGNVKNGLTDDNVRDNTKYVECSRNISNICNYGSMCLMDKVTNLVTCECDMNCDPFETMSLCGSDSVTYKNLCHLKQSKCLQQRAIKIVNHDTCEQLEASLCKSKNCPFYGKCKIDESGFYAKCVCPDECDLSSTSQVFVFSDYEYEPSSSSSGPSSSPSNSILNRAIASSSTSSTKGQKSKELITNELFSQIVCGSDGVDYKNFCQLKKESCQLSKEIKVYYFGKCNPCHDITCVYPKICRLNSNRQPECTCDLQCHNSYKPVCASNGKTYMNECFMNLESCRLNRPLRIVHNNDCSYTRNPCDQIVCDQYIGSYCEIDQQGRAFCKCEEKCEKILNYVCGSDGVTYENECNLRRESCMSNQLITVQHLGICGTMNPCVNYPCNFGGTCELVNNIPTCKCVECSEVFVPVCGTDGMTYSNICKLRRESCMKRTLIEIEYDGICDRCKSINCPFYGTCIDDGLETKCVCQETCADIFIPTCGSDGVTYNSVCHLQLNSCKTQKMITVLHNGNCDPCMELKCEKTTVDYVCGSDGVTHANECYLNMTACISKTEITVRHKGICPNDHETNQVKLKQSCQECQFNAECIFFKDNNTFMCSCSNFDCSNEDRNLLCGSNGKVYENKCELEKDMCLNQREIKEQPLDNCLGDSIVCDGYTPLINFQSQLPYTCRSNRDCPSDSFCDQHHLRCCSKKVNHIHTGVKCKKNSDCNNENMLCIANDCILISNCLNTTHGCCPDGYTPAKGKNGKGCPKFCNCHPAGSYNQICDERTGNCHCRPGVVGKLCDSCAIGYWGIKKILDSKYIGCLPCSCNKYGSLREDCNQEDGRCECKSGVFGIKCTECLPGQELTPDGCVSLMEQQKQIENLCANLNCNYPGAYCSVDEGNAKCICDTINCISDGRVVCGEDGQTYASECDLIKFSCAKQTEIPIAYFGKCTQVDLLDFFSDNSGSNNNNNNNNNKNTFKKTRNKINQTNERTSIGGNQLPKTNHQLNKNRTHHNHHHQQQQQQQEQQPSQNQLHNHKNNLKITDYENANKNNNDNTINKDDDNKRDVSSSTITLDLLSSSASKLTFSKANFFPFILIIILNKLLCRF